MRTLLAIWVLTLAGAARAAPVTPPTPRYGPKGFPAAPSVAAAPHAQDTFLYAGYFQTVGANSAGAGAVMLQGDPSLAIADAHTLAEIGLSSADSKQIVEIGWHVDALVNGDVQPRLFVFHWVNGTPTCYNGCGWVQVSPTIKPGMRVTAGETATYAIKLEGGDWRYYYNGEYFGYFPGSLWTAPAYTAVGYTQWFGEIAAETPGSCSEMGNGVFGEEAGATTMTDLHVFAPGGAKVAAAATVGTVTNETFYRVGQTTPTSFGFGGPGARVGCCTPGTCADFGAQCGTVPDRCETTRPCGACDEGVCGADFTCAPGASGDATMGGEDDEDGGCCSGAGPSSLLPGLFVGVLLLPRRRRAR